MNKTVDQYIAELLFLHDCVILPEFGGFVGNPISAKLNKITQVLTPPSKQILFNTNLKINDGLLIAHISNKENISQDIAKNEVEDYINKITEKLNRSKVLRIDKIGLFTLGKEGNIIFLQDSSNNYSLDSFGMKAIHNKSIIKQHIVEEKLATTIKKINTNNNAKKLFLKAAAVIIPLITLSYLSIFQKDNINTIYTQMASINPFESNTVLKPIEKNTTEINIKIAAKPTTESIEQQQISTVISQRTYYIIAGAFAQQKNANRMLNKLTRWNYNAEIIESNNLYRVCYDSFYNRQEAILSLNKIKQENPEAWLLTK